MESVTGTAKVMGMREQVVETDAELAERLAGVTLSYSGYKVGEEVIGWAENLEVTVSSAGIFVEAIHSDPDSAEAAARQRADTAPVVPALSDPATGPVNPSE